jgi:hypothetical protein
LSQLTGPNQYIDQLLQTTSHENPYLAQTADRIGQQTGAQLASSFGGSGRSGSGLAALLGGQGIGDALSTFYGNQYNNDQQLRASALTNAAQMQQSGITNAAQLSQQGTQSAAAHYRTQPSPGSSRPRLPLQSNIRAICPTFRRCSSWRAHRRSCRFRAQGLIPARCRGW